MTFLGKILVFVNLVISLGCAAIAVGIYTNHVDWAGPQPAPPDSFPGIYSLKKADFDRYDNPKTGLVGVSRSQWLAARDDLARVEKQQLANQDWYVQKLANLEGRDDSGKLYNKPIEVLAIGKNGLSQVNRDGLPELETSDSSPLLIQRLLFLEQLDTTGKEIKAVQKDIAQLATQADELTRKINGSIDGKERGQRDLVKVEQTAQTSALAAIDYVKPLRVNREVEGQLLFKRQRLLQSRIDELKRVGLAARQ